jgi:hypothetical protein
MKIQFKGMFRITNGKRPKPSMELLGKPLIQEAPLEWFTQNQFKTGLDIAKYTAAIMRKTWQNMMQIPLITPLR